MKNLLRRVFRSSSSGRFTTSADAALHPESTTAETLSDAPAQLGRLRWRCADLESVMLQVAGALKPEPEVIVAARKRLEDSARDRIVEESAVAQRS